MFYVRCEGSVRCCRDCKLIGLTAHWKAINAAVKNHPSTDIILETVESEYDIEDVHFIPMVWSGGGLASLILLYVIAIVVSMYEAKVRRENYYKSNETPRRLRRSKWNSDVERQLPDVIGSRVRRRGTGRKYHALENRMDGDTDDEDEEIYTLRRQDEWTTQPITDNGASSGTAKQQITIGFLALAILVIVLGTLVHAMCTFAYIVALVVGTPQNDTTGQFATKVIEFLRGDILGSKALVKTMSPIWECRIVFTAMVMTLWVSILFIVTVFNTINFSYNKTIEKRQKAFTKLLQSNNMDVDTAKLFVETIDIMKADQCQADEKLFSFNDRKSKGCLSACCGCIFKLMIIVNGLCVLAWLLVCTDIILLYNSTCLIPSECR